MVATRDVTPEVISELCNQWKADVQIEDLSLEDIFLEMHQLMIAQIGEVLATYWRRAISSRLAMLAAIVPRAGDCRGSACGEETDRHGDLDGDLWSGPDRTPFQAADHSDSPAADSQCGCGARDSWWWDYWFCVEWHFPRHAWPSAYWSWGALGFVFALAAVTFALFAVQTGWLLVLITPFIFMCLLCLGATVAGRALRGAA